MLASDELYKMKHCIGLDYKKPKRGVYEAFRNGVMYYEPNTIWESLWSKGYAKRSIQPYGIGDRYTPPRDLYYYSINEEGLKEMEKYLGIKIKILR